MRDGWAVESGQYQRATGRNPDWLQDVPELQRGDEFYIKAFWELSTCRHYSGGAVGPIPWDKIMDYANKAGLDSTMEGVFLEAMRGLDVTWLRWRGKK